MNNRLKEIFSNLPNCSVFADIGCDHGYMAQAMIKSGKCQKAIISDVSAKCLKKAEDLLADYIAQGRVDSAVSNGFDKVGKCDLALIAGMGGEEIVGILTRAKSLPEKLVLQPMKNVDKVRVALVKEGYRIEKDYVFFASGVYYDLIVAVKGKDCLTEEEIAFGRTNIREGGKDFKQMLMVRVEKYRDYLVNSALSGDDRRRMEEEIQRLEKYV